MNAFLARTGFWPILAMSFAAVGAKNSEMGLLQVDSYLYAHLARTVARGGEWFHLHGIDAFMDPFAEHPHLGIWLQALVFKLLPAADWSARLLNQCTYFLFLWGFFSYLKEYRDRSVAVATIVVLFLWFRFANFFSTAYLDPLTLLFGSISLFLLERSLSRSQEGMARTSLWMASAAGAALAACALTKGLTVLGFLPGLAVLVAVHAALRNAKPFVLASVLLCVLATAATLLAVYAVSLQASDVPQFLTKYWDRQWVGRFERQWSWWGLFSSSFWLPLLKDTHYLVLLVPFGFARLVRMHHVGGIAAATTALTFWAMYAPAGRVANQYWVVLLPWLAWGVGEVVCSLVRFDPRKWLNGLGWAAVGFVLFIQWSAIRVHGPEPVLEKRLQYQVSTASMQELFLDLSPNPYDFTYGDYYYWYADVPIRPKQPDDAVPVAKPRQGYLLVFSDENRKRRLRQKGWCEDHLSGQRTLWVACK